MEHSFDVEEAVAFGVHEAVLIRHFRYWITKNRADKRHFHDGHTWSYNSLQAMADSIFPYLSREQVKRIMNKLTDGDDSVMIKGNYNQDSRDRTTWYAFRDESLFIPSPDSDKDPVHRVKRPHTQGETTPPLPDKYPDKYPDSSPLPPIGGIPPSGEGETKVGKARRVHEHHCRVMSDNPDKPREWKFEVYEAAYYRMLKKFTPEELMLASTNLAASKWHRGDNPDGKQYCDPFWLFGEKQAAMKVAAWIEKGGGADGAPTTDEQYIHAHYANLRDRHGDAYPQEELDYMRRQDEGRATKAGKGLSEFLRDEAAKRERLKAQVG